MTRVNTNTSVMQIRPYAEPAEQPVVDLWRVCELTRPWNDPNRDIERKLQVQRGLLPVGDVDGRIIGSVMAGFGGHRGWINYLAVHPEFRRRGLATRLMKAAEDLLLEVGCPKVNLQVRSTNATATAFYESLGFARDDVLSFGKRIVPDATAASRQTLGEGPS